MAPCIQNSTTHTASMQCLCRSHLGDLHAINISNIGSWANSSWGEARKHFNEYANYMATYILILSKQLYEQRQLGLAAALHAVVCCAQYESLDKTQ